MSPALIAGIILAGVMVLVGLAFVNQTIERNKLDKARRKIEFSDKARRFQYMLDGLPPQFLNKDLKRLILQGALYNLHKLSRDSSDPAVQQRISAINNQLSELAASDDSAITPQPITTLEQAHEIRGLLQDLHQLIISLLKQGQVDRKSAEVHIQNIRYMLVQASYDVFTNQAKSSIAQGKTRLALHYYNRIIQELERNNEKGRYTAEIAKLKQTCQELQQNGSGSTAKVEPVNDEWAEYDKEEEDWKQKSQYDDELKK